MASERQLLGFFLEHLAGVADRRKEIINAEWSLGNGQCPICLGCNPGKTNWGPGATGHERGCLFDLAIRAIKSQGIKKKACIQPSPVENPPA